MVRLAYDQQKAGDAAAAERCLDAAAQAAGRMEDKQNRCELLNFVSYAYGRLKFPKKTRDTLAATRTVADEIERPESRIPILAMMAEVYERFLESSRAAENLMTECEQLADSIKAADVKVRALMDIAYRHSRLKHAKQVSRLEQKAESIAQGLSATREQSEAYLQLAVGLAKQKSSRADEVFNTAETLATKISDPLSRGHALLLIAKQMKQVGRGEQANAILAKAKAIAESIADSSQRDPLLEDIDRAW